MWPRRPSLPCLPPNLSNASAHSPHPGHAHTHADAHGSLSLAQKFWTCKHLRGPWTHPCSACCILPGPSPASFIRPLLAIPLSQSQSCFFQKVFTSPSPLMLSEVPLSTPPTGGVLRVSQCKGHDISIWAIPCGMSVCPPRP